MPNQQAIENAALRRQARKASRDKAIEQAHSEAENFSDTVAASKAAAAEAAERPAERKKTNREQIDEQRKAAAEEVLRQSQQPQVKDVNVNSYLGGRRRGPIPLNVLNKAAHAVTTAVKDDARAIANAAGKAAFSAASGRRDRLNAPDRHARARDAQAALDAARAQTAKTE